MKKRSLFLSLVTFALGISLCWQYVTHKQDSNTPPTVATSKRPLPNDKNTARSNNYSYPSILRIAMANKNPARDIMIKMYTAPIDFWGKVIDEKGNPISKAKIEYNVADKPLFDTSGIKIDGESDEYGKFSLTNEKGSFLQVFVSKDGYYGKTGISTHTLRYGLRGRPGIKLPTPENPTIFVLRKRGEGAALIRIPYQSHRISKDGTPFEIKLKTGQKAFLGQGDLKVEYWALSEKDSTKHFDWRCRISVAGGGVTPWKGQEEFDFKAPSDGYQTFDEISMPKTTECWLNDVTRKYFVKTANNKYASIEFGIIAANEPFFVIKGYYNPSGSRNLEFDPEKLINK